ncbi:2564_t:CDS:2, partial [Entrophospora sp. SA101]
NDDNKENNLETKERLEEQVVFLQKELMKLKEEKVSEYMNVKEILSLKLPPLTYFSLRKSTGTTISSYQQSPQETFEWDGFIEDQQFKQPHFLDFRISDEPCVHQAIDHNIFRLLNTLEGDRNIDYVRYTAFPKVVGESDFICHKGSELLLVIEIKTKWENNLETKERLEEQVVFLQKELIKLKEEKVSEYMNVKEILSLKLPPLTYFSLRKSTGTTISSYQQSPQETFEWDGFIEDGYVPGDGSNSIIHIIKQIYGYMAANHLQYGVLATYDQTWFLKQSYDEENLGKLYISPSIGFNLKQPTIIKAYLYVQHLAEQSQYCPSPPPSPLLSLPPSSSSDENESSGNDDTDYQPGRKRKYSSAGKKQSSQTKKSSLTININKCYKYSELSLKEFKFCHAIGFGQSGTVHLVFYQGRQIALKISDLSKHPELLSELQNEVHIYEKLQKRNIMINDSEMIMRPEIQWIGFGMATMIANSHEPIRELNKLRA